MMISHESFGRCATCSIESARAPVLPVVDDRSIVSPTTEVAAPRHRQRSSAVLRTADLEPLRRFEPANVLNGVRGVSCV